MTLHLLGGTGLLALLCVPAVGLSRAARQQRATVIAPALRAGLWLGLALLVLQCLLGAGATLLPSPLWVVLLHNFLAALLLAVVASLVIGDENSGRSVETAG